MEENALTVNEKTAFYGSEDMMTSSSLIHKMQLCFPICCEIVCGIDCVFSPEGDLPSCIILAI